MKEFRLSTAAERISGICFTVAVIASFAALLYALRHQIGMMIVCGLGVLLISVLLVIYVLSVLKAAVCVDGEKKSLVVCGVRNYTLDLSDAVLMQTFARKNGQSTVRVIVFSDKDEKVIATVPTMFTFRQGIWAEPVAKEIAAALGIEFKQNVPDWMLDKKKYKQHLKEEEERQRAEAKERRQKRMEQRIQKAKKRK